MPNPDDHDRRHPRAYAVPLILINHAKSAEEAHANATCFASLHPQVAYVASPRGPLPPDILEQPGWNLPVIEAAGRPIPAARRRPRQHGAQRCCERQSSPRADHPALAGDDALAQLLEWREREGLVGEWELVQWAIEQREKGHVWAFVVECQTSNDASTAGDYICGSIDSDGVSWETCS